MAHIQQRGDAFSVRWQEGGRKRSRSFTARAQGSVTKAKKEAEKFVVEVERRKESGDLGYYSGLNMQLMDLVGQEWWPRHAELELEPKTLALYSWLWNKHILPYLGSYEMREIRAGTIRDWKITLQKSGLGDPTIRKAMSLLQGIFRWAAEDELIPPLNPVQVVKKPSAKRQIKIKPLSADSIEAIRVNMDSLTDRTLISVLGYGGLRPEEALALTWEHVRENTILVDQKLVDGEIVSGTKTEKTRTVDMIPVLAEDLAELREEANPKNERELVFPRKDGKPWSDSDRHNWRKRVFRVAMKKAKLEGRIYDLRHSWASLLIQAGHKSAYVAEQLGHSIAVSMNTYQHVFEEVQNPDDWQDPETEIRKARRKRRRK